MDWKGSDTHLICRLSIPMEILLVFCLFSGVLVHGQTTLVAKIDLEGVKGDVTFVQNAIGSPVTYTFSLQGINEAYDWDIYQFRVNYDTQGRCADAVVGTRYGNLTKSITTGTETGTFNGVDLSGSTSIEGRSILLKKQSDQTVKVCGTIESSSDYVTAMARLPVNIAGDVIFRQIAGSSETNKATIYADVFYVEGSSSPTDLKWYIYDGEVGADIATRCSVIGELFNPKTVSESPCSTDHSKCAVGNLNGKLGDISIGVTKGEGKQLFHDENLYLSGTNSIIGKILVVKSLSESTISCGNIVQIKERQATARFSSDGVTGDFTISQRSPFDFSSISIAFDGLASTASGYHIHKWPVPRRLDKTDNLCSNDLVSGHFNPFNVNVASSPSAGTGTPDQYEVGDISGKFGTLDNKNNLTTTFTDSNLQLFGINNVMGRSVVIHKAVDGSRWVCSNIIFSGNLKVSKITFHYPVIGHMQFQQPQDYLYSDTSIYIDLNYGDGSTSTSNHNWHIHVKKIGTDFDASDGRCMSVTGHFNPYSVDLDGNYNTECRPDNPLRCELGDLSSKHTQLLIRNGQMGAKHFFTDVNLPLTGPQSITDLSLVIHGADSAGARLSCANIYEVPKRVAKVSTWTSQVTGVISFEEVFGLVISNVQMDVILNNLGGLAGGYHVHEYPVTIGNCLPADVGGHLDPFGIGANNNIASETNDKYEIGDLSAKFGMLTSLTSYSATKQDNNLPLRGLYSIVGRSIVIHKNDQGASRWSCGNITEDLSVTNGRFVRVRATFKEGDIQGYVEMEQYIYPDGGMSDTGVLLDLKYKDGRANTNNHNWHVHINPIGDDAVADTGRCQSAGLHYNPFHSNLTDGYDECSFKNPLRCELGDQSSKLSQYEIGGGKRFYVDVNLPLAGPFTVLGRSVVIHAKEGGAPRIACTDILPAGKYLTLSYKKITDQLNSTYAINTFSNAVSTDAWNIRVEEIIDATETDCRNLKIYFVGELSDSLFDTFSDLLKSGNVKSLKEFAPFKCSSPVMSLSIFLLLTMILLNRWLN